MIAARRLFLYEYFSASGLAGAAAHSLLAEGRSMRDALRLELQALPGWQLSVAAAEAGPGQVVPAPDERPLAFVQRQAALHDWVWVIAPETEGLLAQLQTALPHGVGWVGCSAQAIAVASSKAATRAVLAAAGLLVPRPGLDARGRWVVKPDDGAGCVATRLHGHEVAARADQAQRPSAVLEPWVEGEALSLSLLCQPGHTRLLSVNRQHVQLRVQLNELVDVHCDALTLNVMPASDARWPRLQALAQSVSQCLPGLRGFVGIDLVWHAEAGPVVIEVNPRVTSALVGLSAALGQPVVAQVLQGFVHG